ncbi:plasmid mobilization relaxosome protein MobC [Agathobaculum butyriciproducens]|uniref:plasmid mobilization protein n=1 Tax=Agathobaculum butyriciproducens TaxID=1628085 RepID=UPI002097FA91|nr:plasmid mobilization relaxosome protein MobC [Agathobaculum butyriciproducens]
MNDGEQKKRKRAVQIIVRVTPEEKAEILKNMESVGISNLSVYARKMMLDGQVIHADFTEIKELSRQLGYLARNINQIALRANETRNLYKSDVEDLQRDYAAVKDEILTYLTKAVKSVSGDSQNS